MIYQGVDDPELINDLKLIHIQAQKITKSYQDILKKETPDPELFFLAINEYEDIHEKIMRLYSFAFFHYKSDISDPVRMQLYQKIRDLWYEISETLGFFQEDFLNLKDKEFKKIIKYSKLNCYRYFLLRQYNLRNYQLHDVENRFSQRKNCAGKDAFLLLYDELSSSLISPIQIKSESKLLKNDPVLDAARLQQRKLDNEEDYNAYLQRLSRYGLVFKNILNALLFDYNQKSRERGFFNPVSVRHLANDVKEEVIANMLQTVDTHYQMARRFFSIKADLLGLKKLKHTDIFAPLNKKGFKVSFPKAKVIILDILEATDPIFHQNALDIFNNARIDMESRYGKLPGALCKCFSPSLEPCILMSYGDDIRDMMVLVHEIGHGIHYKLSSKNSCLTHKAPPVLAEMAAIFFELIITHHLLSMETYKELKQELTVLQAEGIIKNVFRQHILISFEISLHSLRDDHPLGEDDICKLWWDANSCLYGDKVDMPAQYLWGWAHVPHIFHAPFYCYSYIFGNLLAILLFQKYLKEGNSLIKKIVLLFSSGFSRSPFDLLNEVGLNIHDYKIWEQAMKYFDDILDHI